MSCPVDALIVERRGADEVAGSPPFDHNDARSRDSLELRTGLPHRAQILAAAPQACSKPPNSSKIMHDRGVSRLARERQPPGSHRKKIADEPLLLSWIRVFIFLGAHEAPRQKTGPCQRLKFPYPLATRCSPRRLVRVISD